jgi:hypothetical protein
MLAIILRSVAVEGEFRELSLVQQVGCEVAQRFREAFQRCAPRFGRGSRRAAAFVVVWMIEHKVL